MIDSSLLCESTYDVSENTAPAPHSSSSRRASLIETSPWARLFSSYEVTQENKKLESSDRNWGKKNTLSTTISECFSTPMEQMPRRIINIPTTGLAVGRPVDHFQKAEFDQGSHD